MVRLSARSWYGSPRLLSSFPRSAPSKPPQEALPRTPLIEQGPAVAPYNPPALGSPSDSVAQSDQSFQFNRCGVRRTNTDSQNNPANRDEYVREQLNK